MTIQVVDTNDLIMSLDGSTDCDIQDLWPTLKRKFNSWCDVTKAEYRRIGQLRPVVVGVSPDEGWIMGNGHHRLAMNYYLGWPTLVYFDLEMDLYCYGLSTDHWDDQAWDWLKNKY